jgi:hypothetical protein
MADILVDRRKEGFPFWVAIRKNGVVIIDADGEEKLTVHVEDLDELACQLDTARKWHDKAVGNV